MMAIVSSASARRQTKTSASTATKSTVAATDTKAAAASAMPAFSGSAKAIGSPNAPITMEVFSDYQCPSCRALFEETLKPLIADYVALGKVYLVHRDFPLPMHSHSWVAV